MNNYPKIKIPLAIGDIDEIANSEGIEAIFTTDKGEKVEVRIYRDDEDYLSPEETDEEAAFKSNARKI